MERVMVLYLRLYTSALGIFIVLHVTIFKMKTIVTYSKPIFRNEHLMIFQLKFWKYLTFKCDADDFQV